MASVVTRTRSLRSSNAERHATRVKSVSTHFRLALELVEKIPRLRFPCFNKSPKSPSRVPWFDRCPKHASGSTEAKRGCAGKVGNSPKSPKSPSRVPRFNHRPKHALGSTEAKRGCAGKVGNSPKCPKSPSRVPKVGNSPLSRVRCVYKCRECDNHNDQSAHNTRHVYAPVRSHIPPPPSLSHSTFSHRLQ
jgi:hypothetical protein